MSTYNLTTQFTPIKEVSGVIRNTTNGNIEYAVSNGGIPPQGAGNVLAPGYTVPFDLHNPVTPPMGPFSANPMGPMGPMVSGPVPAQTMFVRAVSINAANPTPTIFVDGKFNNPGMAYDVSGVSLWQPLMQYAYNQYVIYDRKLWRSLNDHIEGNVWDVRNWELISNNISDISAGTDSQGNTILTLVRSDGSQKVITLGATGGSTTGGSGNTSAVISQILQDIQTLQTAFTSLTGSASTVQGASNTNMAAVTQLQQDVAALQQKLANLNSTASSIAASGGNLTPAQLAQLLQDIADLQQAVAALTNSAGTVGQTSSATNSAIQQMMQDIAALQQALSGLQTTANTAQTNTSSSGSSGSSGGTGDVTGPSSAVDGNIAVFDGTTGKAIKDSGEKAQDLRDDIDTVADVVTAMANMLDPVLLGGANHNGLFRGDNLGTINSVSDADKFANDHGLSAGSFQDLYIGDSITINDGTYNVTWRVAAFDWFYDKGSPNLCKKHHAVLFPTSDLTKSQMNTTATTQGGFSSTLIATTVLPMIAAKLKSVLGSHLMTRNTMMSSVVNANLPNDGSPAPGRTTMNKWVSAECTLPSSSNIDGTTIFRSSMFDGAEDEGRLPLFQYMPQPENMPTAENDAFWLKEVANGSMFTLWLGNGKAICADATYTLGVRPLICIC